MWCLLYCFLCFLYVSVPKCASLGFYVKTLTCWKDLHTLYLAGLCIHIVSHIVFAAQFAKVDCSVVVYNAGKCFLLKCIAVHCSCVYCMTIWCKVVQRRKRCLSGQYSHNRQILVNILFTAELYNNMDQVRKYNFLQ